MELSAKDRAITGPRIAARPERLSSGQPPSEGVARSHGESGSIANPTAIVLDHCGGPLGVGPFAVRREEVFRAWRQDIRTLAACPNVVVKLGGLAMGVGGFRFDREPLPPTSERLAAAWRPIIETCIEAFGAARCMFESNFPVDKGMCSYPVLWNAFKRLAAGCSDAEKAALFAGTAANTYRLGELPDGLAPDQSRRPAGAPQRTT